MPKPDDLLPLKPLHFLMLLTLVDSERHAYGIKKDLAARGAHRDIGPGTLYRCIEQLIDSGLIQESDRRPVAELDDERRRYYKLTAFGRRVVAAEAARLDDLVAAARARKLLPQPGGRDDGPFRRNDVPLADARLSCALPPHARARAVRALSRRSARRP